jgi:hypothetical protein
VPWGRHVFPGPGRGRLPAIGLRRARHVRARRGCPRQGRLPTRRLPGGAAPCAKVVAATVCPLAPVGHNVGMIVMTTMRADLG